MVGPPRLEGEGRNVAVCHPSKDGQLPLIGLTHMDAAVESRGEAAHHIVEDDEQDERQPIDQEQPDAASFLDPQDKQQQHDEELVRCEVARLPEKQNR